MVVAVTHAKFGPGRIVEELGDGKVRVEFEGGEARVLLRRFLTDA
jgi:hypothetical protein